uniref:Reverse transcriptase zinc-binding domain-containing protein n=2 Tax=Micrurus surinamensis TaxID=129470 RepID=A0A2D4PQN9_MICSU
MYLELGIRSVECMAWISAFKWWFRMLFLAVPGSYLSLVFADSHTSRWEKELSKKLHLLGFTGDALGDCGLKDAQFRVVQRLVDIDLQYLRSRANKTCSPLIFSHSNNYGLRMASYLYTLTIPKYRRAFSLARFNVLPSALLSGRFKKLLLSERLCPCDRAEVETVEHVLIHCPIYNTARIQLWSSIGFDLSGFNANNLVVYCLGDKSSYITAQVSKFFLRAVTVRGEQFS